MEDDKSNEEGYDKTSTRNRMRRIRIMRMTTRMATRIMPRRRMRSLTRSMRRMKRVRRSLMWRT